MANIKKIKEGTATIYPATIPQAVVDPTSGKTVRTELDEKATSAELSQLAGEVSLLRDDATVKMENLVVNGDFRNGVTGWISHSGSTLSIVDGKLKVALASTAYGSARKDNIPTVSGNKYYKAFVFSHDSTVAEALNFQLGSSADTSSIQPNTRTVRSIVQTISTTGNTSLYIGKYSQTTVFNIYVEKAILINLTATFGAGNEPTKEEFELLLSIMGSQYFEGDVTITAQMLIRWQLAMIRQNRNAIIALGGTII